MVDIEVEIISLFKCLKAGVSDWDNFVLFFSLSPFLKLFDILIRVF